MAYTSQLDEVVFCHDEYLNIHSLLSVCNCVYGCSVVAKHSMLIVIIKK